MLLFLAAIPPLLWASINHVDKYAVDRFMKGREAGSLVIFTGIAGLLVAILLHLVGAPSSVPFLYAIPMLAAGTMLVLSYVPYLYALEHDEATNIAPLFQLVAPLAYLSALVFLHERVQVSQLAAGGVIFLGALVLSFDFKRTRIKAKSFFLMLLTSFMIALNVVMFKSFALSTDFWTSVYYDVLGAAIAGAILFLVISSYRTSFIGAIREHKYKVVLINMYAELLNIFARMINCFVALTLSIAVVQFINGLQPLFILILGIVFTKFTPQYVKEAVDRKALIQKGVAIALMISGLALLSFFV